MQKNNTKGVLFDIVNCKTYFGEKINSQKIITVAVIFQVYPYVSLPILQSVQ